RRPRADPVRTASTWASPHRVRPVWPHRPHRHTAATDNWTLRLLISNSPREYAAFIIYDARAVAIWTDLADLVTAHCEAAIIPPRAATLRGDRTHARTHAGR